MAVHRDVIMSSAFSWPIIYVVSGIYLILNSNEKDLGIKKGAAHQKNVGHHHIHHPFLYYFFSGTVALQSLIFFFYNEFGK